MSRRQAKTRSIVHAANYAPSYSGNFVASLKSLAEEARAGGFRLVWVFPEEVRKYPWFGALVEERDSTAYTIAPGDGLLSLARQLRRIVRAEHAAILHTHFSRFDIAAYVANLTLPPGQKTNVVWHVHTFFPPTSSPLRRAKDYLKYAVMGHGTHVVPVSDHLGAEVLRRGIPPGRLRVVGNGVDVLHATRRHRSRAEVRRELQIPDGSKVLLGFGWAPLVKGVDVMLDCHQLLRAEGRDVTLVIVGTDDLRRFVSAHAPGNGASVRVIPPVENVGELFGACEVFLSPSRNEGWVYSAAEALVNGVPVTASDIPGLLWARGAPGIYLSLPGSAEALADSVRLVLSQTEAQAAEQAERGRRFIEERHTAQQWARSVFRLYEEILGGRA